MRAARRLLVVVLAWVPVVAGACNLAPLPIIGDGIGRLGDVSVSLGAADDPLCPAAWQGPLRIAIGRVPACVVGDEVTIVEPPLMLGNGILYVPTYSGSNNRLYAVDAGNCRVLWRSRGFNGPPRFGRGHIAIGHGQVRLDQKCRPVAMAASAQ